MTMQTIKTELPDQIVADDQQFAPLHPPFMKAIAGQGKLRGQLQPQNAVSDCALGGMWAQTSMQKFKEPEQMEKLTP